MSPLPALLPPSLAKSNSLTVVNRESEVFQHYAEIVELPRKARATLWAMTILLGTAIVWAAFARLDIVISAEGELKTAQPVPVIQAYELSLVRQILVKPGDSVKKGEVLAVLDPTVTKADTEDAASRVRTDAEALARIDAELHGRAYERSADDEASRVQSAIFMRRQVEVQAKLAATEQKVRYYEAQLAAKRVEAPLLIRQMQVAVESQRIYEQLTAEGNASKLRLYDAQRATAEAGTKVVENNGEQHSLEKQIESTKADFDSYMGERNRELADEYSKTRVDYDDNTAKLAKANLRGGLIELRSPVDGTVQAVAKRASGSVVREAETLVTIVPADAVTVAEVMVQTKDISRIMLGDPVVMKLESLPYQQYGFLEGRLMSLTPDTLTNKGEQNDPPSSLSLTSDENEVPSGRSYYRAEIAITRSALRSLPRSFVLRSGMKVTADVNVGTRSVFHYILNPLTRSIYESMREP